MVQRGIDGMMDKECVFVFEFEHLHQRGRAKMSCQLLIGFVDWKFINTPEALIC